MKRYADLGGGIPPACRLGLATRGTSKLDVRDVRAAIDRGINYLNWCGHPDGLSRAISELGSQRDEVVIAWQIMARDAERAGPELDAALKELQTDRIDIVTLYYIESDAEWAGIKAPDGALSAVEAAKSDGRVRIVGLTSHQRKLAAKWAATDRLDMLMLRYNAAPSADGVLPLICLDARAVLAGKNGSRKVAVEEIFVGPGETILESGELLTAIVIPERPECSAGSYRRMTPRAEMDIAFVGVGSWMALNDDGVVEDCRIALSAVAPTPIRAASAEDVLRGSPMTDARVEEAAEKAATEARPISDHRSSAEYRLHVVRALTRRTLDDCATRLRGNERSDWP